MLAHAHGRLFLLGEIGKRLAGGLPHLVFVRREAVGHVLHFKEFVDIHLAVPHIAVVDIGDKHAADVEPRRSQHPFLIGAVRKIHVLDLRARLDLDDVVALFHLMEDIDGAVAVVLGKRRLTDVLNALREVLPGILEHSGDVQPAVLGIGGRFDVVAEKSHREIAHLVALRKAAQKCGVFLCQFPLVGVHPKHLGALQIARKFTLRKIHLIPRLKLVLIFIPPECPKQSRFYGFTAFFRSE